MSAAELNARYEQLRRRLTGRHTPGGGDGLVVLVRQGLHAWIAHVVAAPRPRGPEAPPALASGTSATAFERSPLLDLCTDMLLATLVPQAVV